MLGRIGFALVQWRARRGLSDAAASPPEEQKLEALPGVRGETRAYWYLWAPRLYLRCSKLHVGACQRRTRSDRLRRRYTRVRRGAHSPRRKGQIALPELSITPEKHEVLIRTAHYFLRERHIKECPLRFDVVAIDNTPGQPPVVRLHKSALSPVVHRHSDR
jgi:hypothetical protein